MASAHSMLTALARSPPLRHPACADQSAETDRCPSNAGSRGMGSPSRMQRHARQEAPGGSRGTPCACREPGQPSRRMRHNQATPLASQPRRKPGDTVCMPRARPTITADAPQPSDAPGLATPAEAGGLSSRETRHPAVFAWQTQFAGAALRILRSSLGWSRDRRKLEELLDFSHRLRNAPPQRVMAKKPLRRDFCRPGGDWV